MEYCRFRFGEAMVIEGQVVGDLGGIYGAMTYEVHCHADGSTHWVRGLIHHDGGELAWSISRDANGLWTVNGVTRPDLLKCLDVDIGVTPSTNTLPIRRIKLAVGSSHELWSAWVRFPDLTVHHLFQRYTRVSYDLYDYESMTSGFKSRLRVDEHGIVQDYAGLWTDMVCES